MDRIFIQDLRCRGKHGVHEREREVEQEFVIDISAECETRAAARSDKLSDTVDYGHFRAIAQEVVEENSFYLIERLAESIAEKILEDNRIASVTVTIRKPSVYPNAVPGVTIVRTR